jgi:virulence-associated protein VapD
MKENGFVHRQGSGYISKKSMTDKDAATIISLMSKNSNG